MITTHAPAPKAMLTRQVSLTPVPPQPPHRRRIVVVEDDPDRSAHLAAALRDDGHDVVVESDGAVALRRVVELTPEIVMVDLGMLPHRNGFEILADVQALGLSTRTIGMTGSQAPQFETRARELGAVGLLRKPVAPETARVLVGQLH
ncbi:MAG: response regulator [Planctomycetota bacterium]